MVAAISKGSGSLPGVHRFSVAEYHALGESGVLTHASRTELINGEIFDMTPIGTRHSNVVDRLNEWFSGRRQGYRVRVQNPVTLGDDSEPQPDIALVERMDYSDRHPGPENVYLIVEVADSSTKFDGDVKARLYAANGVPEYWLMDLVRRDTRRSSTTRPRRLSAAASSTSGRTHCSHCLSRCANRRVGAVWRRRRCF